VRLLALAIATLTLALLAPTLEAQAPTTPAPPPADASARTFGDWDDPTFATLAVPGTGAAEPTIGIPWTTDSLFFWPVSGAGAAVGSSLMRARFDAAGTPTWEDVAPAYLTPVNLDPMLVADPDTGRVFAGGLMGPCSSMVYSDDDGDTWLPSLNMCSGKDFDHQSVGLGPPAGAIPSPEGTHVGYYCAQGGTISCARSVDQGSTWLPFQEVPGSCGGFHGHIRVSPVTGLVVVPTASCGQHAGYITTADGGLTWSSHEVEESAKWTNGFDPSAQFTRPGGWMYYAMASEHGVHVALSKDEGKTWEPLGGGMGVAPSAWLDVGQFHDPPVVSGVFTNVQAGDDERVAVSFLGLEAGPGADTGFLTSKKIYQCGDRQDELLWHAYLAISYDAGQTWTVERVTDDPVQVGGIWDVTVGGSGNCRNLLDFNDMDIDSHGRIHIGIADGCTGACAANPQPKGDGFRDNAPVVFRQVAGRGLFKAFDGPDTRPDLDKDGIPDAQDKDLDGDGVPNAQEHDVDGDGVDDAQDDDLNGDGVADATQGNVTIPDYTRPEAKKDSPGLPAAAALAAVAVSVAAARRRRGLK
jgi:hypothetical protein